MKKITEALKPMSIKKAVLAILPLSLLVGLVAHSFATPKQSGNDGDFLFARTLEQNGAAEMLNDPVELDSATLKTKLLSSSISKTSQSFTISFSTGGVGWYNGLRKTVLVASEDPEFEEYYNEFNGKTEDQKNEMLEEEGFEPRYFSSYLAEVFTNKSEVVIPKQLWRGGAFDEAKTILNENEEEVENPNYGKWKDGWFCLEPSYINSPVVNDWTGSSIKHIYIPSTITTVSENAFIGIPNTVTIHLEYKQDEIPADFADGWSHDAQVEYDYAYEEEFGFDETGERTSLAYQNAILPQFTKQFGDENINYYIGIYKQDAAESRPLIVKYRLKGSTEVKQFELSNSSQTTDYVAVGKGLGGFTTDVNCDIPIDRENGEEIDPTSIEVHNIIGSKEEEREIPDDNGGTKVVKVLAPDYTKEYFIKASQAYGNATMIEDFVSCRYSGVSTFLGYTNIKMLASITNFDTYSVLKPSFYHQYEREITSKKYHIRYRFTSLANVDFSATYDNKETTVNVVSPISQAVLSKTDNNPVSFLVKNSAFGKDFSTKKLQAFAFKSLYVTIDIISDEGKPIARSNKTTRFANVIIMPYSENGVGYFDINAFLIIETAAFIVTFAIAATVLFFYLKNKYKNDEFRRMKPKAYLKKAILSLFGSLIVLLEATFIVLRTGVFDDSVVVFNPTDVFIIILGVASILIIGYFIRYLVVSIKANNERRRTIKLKLDEDVVDDGTN